METRDAAGRPKDSQAAALAFMVGLQEPCWAGRPQAASLSSSFYSLHSTNEMNLFTHEGWT